VIAKVIHGGDHGVMRRNAIGTPVEKAIDGAIVILAQVLCVKKGGRGGAALVGVQKLTKGITTNSVLASTPGKRHLLAVPAVVTHAVAIDPVRLLSPTIAAIMTKGRRYMIPI